MTPTLGYLLTVLSGAAAIVAGFALMLWQILSAPDRPNYPTSGRVKRTLMFWFMAALYYRGFEVIVMAGDEPPVLFTDGQLIASLLLAALFISFLVDHLRNWLPARTRHRINQLLALARCGPSKGLIDARTSAMKNSTGKPCMAADIVSPALAELTLQGATVVGPGEGPDALR